MNRMAYKSGFIAIVGVPNVGKSTLMNKLLNFKVAITSVKEQTTRNKITGILSGDGYQMVFLDTPGIHTPKTRLGRYMVSQAQSSVNGADVVLFLVEPRGKISEENLAIIEMLKKSNVPVFLVINKLDTVEFSRLLEIIDKYSKLGVFKEIIPISAQNGDNTDELLKTIVNYLPEGPRYFPEDMVTDQPEKQIAAELIREKALWLLSDEIPHGIAIEIFSMKTRDDKPIVEIEANIYCEKDTHKAIIIGKHGAKLKEIGIQSRRGIERLLGNQVHLSLWVKVKKDWRDSERYVRDFGYTISD